MTEKYWTDLRSIFPKPTGTLSELMGNGNDSEKQAIVFSYFFDMIKNIIDSRVSSITARHKNIRETEIYDTSLSETFIGIADCLNQCTDFTNEDAVKNSLEKYISKNISIALMIYDTSKIKPIGSIEYKLATTELQPDENLTDTDCAGQINDILKRKLTPIEKSIREARLSGQPWIEIAEKLNMGMGTILYYHTKTESFVRTVHKTLTEPPKSQS